MDITPESAKLRPLVKRRKNGSDVHVNPREQSPCFLNVIQPFPIPTVSLADVNSPPRSGSLIYSSGGSAVFNQQHIFVEEKEVHHEQIVPKRSTRLRIKKEKNEKDKYVHPTLSQGNTQSVVDYSDVLNCSDNSMSNSNVLSDTESVCQNSPFGSGNNVKNIEEKRAKQRDYSRKNREKKKQENEMIIPEVIVNNQTVDGKQFLSDNTDYKNMTPERRSLRLKSKSRKDESDINIVNDDIFVHPQYSSFQFSQVNSQSQIINHSQVNSQSSSDLDVTRNSAVFSDNLSELNSFGNYSSCLSDTTDLQLEQKRAKQREYSRRNREKKEREKESIRHEPESHVYFESTDYEDFIPEQKSRLKVKCRSNPKSLNTAIDHLQGISPVISHGNSQSQTSPSNSEATRDSMNDMDHISNYQSDNCFDNQGVPNKSSKTIKTKETIKKYASQLLKDLSYDDRTCVARVVNSLCVKVEGMNEESQREKWRLQKRKQSKRKNDIKNKLNYELDSDEDIANLSIPSMRHNQSRLAFINPPTPSTQLGNQMERSLMLIEEGSSTPKRSLNKLVRGINVSENEWNQQLRNNEQNNDESADIYATNTDESIHGSPERSINNDNNRAFIDPNFNDNVLRFGYFRAVKMSKRLKRQRELPSLNKKVSRIIPPENKDYSITKNAVPDLLDLKERKICIHCRALTYTFNCCSHGKVKIPPPRAPPNYIRELLIGKTAAAKEFQKNIVKYNNAFALGSMNYDRERTSDTTPYVKVNGCMHTQLSGMSLPPGKKLPQFHQLYKFDVNEATQYRMMNPVTGNSVKPNIMRNILTLLEQENYLVKQYRTSVELLADMIKVKKPIRNLFVVLRSPEEVNYQGVHHPGTLSRPRQEMQSILYSTEPDGGPGKDGMFIVHRQYGGKLEILGYWNPLIDPVSYPLLFPYGNRGFKSREYKLNEDYVVEQEEFDGYFDDGYTACYPFEGLHDEMEDGVEAIDYAQARLKYKEYLKENGEEVSDSDDDEVSKTGNNIQSIAHNEDNEETYEMEVHHSDDDLDEQNFIRLLENSSDEEVSENDHFPGGHSNLSSNNGADILNDPCGQDMNETNGESDEAKKKIEEWRKEWKEKEAEIRKQILEEEKECIIQYEKIKSFKAACLEFRSDLSLLHRLFKDPVEVKRVLIDLEFMDYKRTKHRDHLYYLADVFFSFSRYRTNLIYQNDFARLQRDIDYEIEYIIADKTYKNDDPKVNHFRQYNLMPSELDDNYDHDYEEPDLIQSEVTDKRDGPTEKKERKPVKRSSGPQVFVTRRQHALHQMQIRNAEFHPYLSTLLLGQLYVIDLALRIIRQRNDNTRDHLIKLRGSHEHTLTYQIQAASAKRKGFNLGYAFQLPNSRPGSVAWYKEQFENAMAVMDHTGKPDLFITMTGNPAWLEIDRSKLPDSTWQSNPFTVNDIFHIKMQECLLDIIENETFGPVVSFCYSIEFQKRGMPHMHLLITLKDGHKLDTSDKIDQHISAKIPPMPEDDDDEETSERKLRFRNNVINHMIHSACINNNDAYCKLRPGRDPNKHYSRCTKNFPYPYNTHTSTIDGGKVEYHRPMDNATCEKNVNRKTEIATNQYVVPYNPHLLNKYGCHINVEAVTTVDVVKYIYKYIYKGFDKALAQFIETYEVDDGCEFGRAPRSVIRVKKDGKVAVMSPYGLKGTMKQFNDMATRIEQELRRNNVEPKDGERLTAYDEAIMVEVYRQMTASEAAWTIQGYYLSGLSHTVINLSVHEEGKMPLFFRAGEHEEMERRKNDGSYKSQLEAWFVLNQKDESARKYTFEEIPLYYKFIRDTKQSVWQAYKNNRMERNVVRVRPVSPRFIECFATRLLVMSQRGPRNWEELRTVNGVVHPTAYEAARAAGLMDNQVEFNYCLNEATKFQFPNRLRNLFVSMLVFGGVNKPRDLWNEYETHFYDRYLLNKPDRARAAALFHIKHLLAQHQRTLADFMLPECDDSIVLTQAEEDFAIDGNETYNIRDNQLEADTMVSSLNEGQRNAYDVIMRAVSANGMGPDGNCFFLQGSGGCGKTFVYRTLYHKLQSMNISVSMIATTGIAATLLIKGCTAHRKFYLPLNCDESSTSNMTIDSGPANEIKETTVLIIDEATMASRFNFVAIDKLLKEIMGNSRKPFGGKIVLLGGDWKQLLPVVPGATSNDAVFHTLKKDELWEHFKVLTLSQNMRAYKDPAYSLLLENVGNGMVNGVPDLDVKLDSNCIAQTPEEVINFIYNEETMKEPKKLAESCILASLNVETSLINEKVLDKVPGQIYTYVAIDTPRDGIGMQVPPEYFSKEMASGMPPYYLNLKVNAIVILLRNLNVRRGLCNGSRLRVVRIMNHFVECELLTTDYAGSMAQGQTFDKVGIILNNNVFSHGQLYVALSRAGESKKIRIFSAARKKINGKSIVLIRNRVEQEILEHVPEENLIDPNYIEPESVFAVEDVNPYKRPRCKQFNHDHSKPVKISEWEKKNKKAKEPKPKLK